MRNSIRAILAGIILATIVINIVDPAKFFIHNKNNTTLLENEIPKKEKQVKIYKNPQQELTDIITITGVDNQYVYYSISKNHDMQKESIPVNASHTYQIGEVYYHYETMSPEITLHNDYNQENILYEIDKSKPIKVENFHDINEQNTYTATKHTLLKTAFPEESINNVCETITIENANYEIEYAQKITKKFEQRKQMFRDTFLNWSIIIIAICIAIILLSCISV